MIKYTLLFLLFAIMQSCFSQKKTISKMDTFNIDYFNENKNHRNIFHYELEDGTLVEEKGGFSNGSFTRKVSSKNSFIKKFYEYYPNGALKKRGDFFDYKFNAGIWEFFSLDGSLEKTVDWDKPFKFGWEDLKAFCEKESININLRTTSIQKDVNNTPPLWMVMWLDMPGQYKHYTINGETGEIILKEVKRRSRK